jgi:diacylglycerol O-acyltransferase / wax synthase
MPIERLTPEDLVMLWPDKAWPQEIGALAFLDGAGLFGAGGGFRVDAARQAVEARLHLLPRFRQLLQVPPKAQGGPLWVDARAFDVAEHVQVVEVPSPGGEPDLVRIAERLASERLDRSRPLWRMWFLTGLPEGRVGWFVKMHHCIADGIAGVATIATLLDADPDAGMGQPQPWTPSPPPSADELIADAHERRSSRRRLALGRLTNPVHTMRALAAAWPAMRELLAEPALPPTSLTRLVGEGRRLALVRSNLDSIKEIARSSDAKVNDVLLAAIAGGLRSLLHDRGEKVADDVLRVYVPVTLRPYDQRAQARGNEIAQMMVPLPVGGVDPRQRLRQIASETARRKARSRPSVGRMPTGGIAGKVFLTLIDRQRVNVETADLPGPVMPLYFAGSRLLEVFPLLPLIGKVSLGIGAFSYAGGFNITVVADRHAFPDLDAFVAGMRRELEALASKSRSGMTATSPSAA